MKSKHEIEKAAWRAASPEHWIETRKGEKIYLDRDDWHIYSAMRWHLTAGHVSRQIKTGSFRPGGQDRTTTVYLWRLVTGCKKGGKIKYRDGNKLNCRKGNLLVIGW